MKQIAVTMKGITPLLMKGTDSMDPTHPLVVRMREITGKMAKKRTESDLKEMDWIEFRLGLYHDGQRVFVPDSWPLATLRGGAKKARQGQEVLAGITTVETEIPLDYPGPTDPEELYEKKFIDKRRVVNKGSGGGVLRVRPRFNVWSLSFTLLIDESVMNPKDAKKAFETAGLLIGMGDFRPRFGRFVIEKWQEVA